MSPETLRCVNAQKVHSSKKFLMKALLPCVQHLLLKNTVMHDVRWICYVSRLKEPSKTVIQPSPNGMFEWLNTKLRGTK